MQNRWMNQEAPTPKVDLPEELGSADASHDGGSENLSRLLEGLLFVADEPVSITRLAQTLDISLDAVDEALADLQAASATRGVRLQRVGRRVQLVSAPEMAPYIERFLGLELHSRLSEAALEALTIVAYQQPVTRAQVEAVRGVNSDSVLRTLISKGLLEEVGRLDAVGRPILYGTTFEFLQFFGLESLDDLPDLGFSETDEPPGDTLKDQPQTNNVAAE
jgi:segregation and condensation protein B